MVRYLVECSCTPYYFFALSATFLVSVTCAIRQEFLDDDRLRRARFRE